MPLRDYQQDAVHELRQAVMQYGSSVYVCPTGAGKTVVFGEIARLAIEKDSRTLFLVHRRELIRQSVDTLAEVLPGLNVGIEAAGWPSMPWSKVQVASVQSLVRRDVDLRPDLIVVDEVHHARAASWTKILDRYPNVPRIGLTATPERLDGKGLGTHFASMTLGPNIPELVEASYLAPTRTLVLPSRFRRDRMRKDRNGELRQQDVQDQLSGAVVADAVDAYLRYASGRKAIFFGIHRQHSRDVCAGLRAKGVRAEHVDGDDTPAHRDRIMMEFKTDGLDVVGNVQLIDEGFDAPSCEVVMMGAPTMSITRYLQQAGRAMRPQEGKTALVLDLAGNSYELGLPDEIREWSLEDGEISQQTKVKAKPRVCSQCRTAFYGGRCPQCAHVEPAAEVEQVTTELEEAKPRLNGWKKGNRKVDLWRDLAIAKRSRDPRSALEAIAKCRGYKSGWVGHVLKAWGKA